MSAIHHIFISHMHGDHYFGLIGLISSFHLLRRTKPLNVYGPAALENVIRLQLKVSGTRLTYPLHFYATNPDKEECILKGDKVRVFSFPLVHGIATTGFRFEESGLKRKLNTAAVEQYNIPPVERRALQLGKDWTDEQGKVIPNAELTHDPTPPLSYAFCSDTRYSEPVKDYVKGVDLLYHESTFTSKEKDLAGQTGHSTAADAAMIAAGAKVRTLVLGHYSSRYRDQSVHLAEAKEHFPNVIAGVDNLRIHVDHDTIHAVQE